MKMEFFQGNREQLLKRVGDHALILVFSGHAPRKTSDEDYPFFANRNFVYLTGIEQKDSVWMAEIHGGEVQETLFLLPSDWYAERWTGSRIKREEAQEQSGISDIQSVDKFLDIFDTKIKSGKIEKLYLDFDKLDKDEPDYEADKMARYVGKRYPFLKLENLHPVMRKLRLIKQPCEIEAMRTAEEITGEGIRAMMRACRPGMKEYQLKAEYDYALAQRGVLTPGFPSIISAGANNFCIHYYGYRGEVCDGDIVLNDVGAVWDHEIVDVSRGWPCNGKYTEKQKLLFTCMHETSEHMFSILKPGIPMLDVDRIIREYNGDQLIQAGVCRSRDNIGTYMWHGGAHHIGFDVHDDVSSRDEVLRPGMVFCIDIGIYHEEWGIGFRLEDNCLVTENGCENLSACIPRTIEDIEACIGAR